MVMQNKKQYINDILPILEDINYRDILKMGDHSRIDKELYNNGFWYILVLKTLGSGFIEIYIERTNSIHKFDRRVRPYPLIYEYWFIYLTRQRDPLLNCFKKDTFGENGKYYVSGQSKQKLPINHCIYCNTSIFSSFKEHLKRVKHKKNVTNFLRLLEETLNLNSDVVRHIHSFI
jgi:hypothetical protein